MSSPTLPDKMIAARLHGPGDVRVESVPLPIQPKEGQALIKVGSVGICGSDLHAVNLGSFSGPGNGDPTPTTLGHEFGGVIESVGPSAMGGNFKHLQPGMRVAVDPANPCWQCPMCEEGNANLCHHMAFSGFHPHDGALSNWMLVNARSCFPVPDSIDDTASAMLEPLGVALHATSLAKIQLADSVAIMGAGSIGLCILQTVQLSGAMPVFVVDRLPWRLEVAKQLGAIPIQASDPVDAIMQETNGRGVDVAIEAAWSDDSVQQAADMLRMGGRMVVVGIPENDELAMNHAVVRRKGVTIRMVRRMKNVYPRAIKLAELGAVDLNSMVTHQFDLSETPTAFDINRNYRDNIVKAVIRVDSTP